MKRCIDDMIDYVFCKIQYIIIMIIIVAYYAESWITKMFSIYLLFVMIQLNQGISFLKKFKMNHNNNNNTIKNNDIILMLESTISFPYNLNYVEHEQLAKLGSSNVVVFEFVSNIDDINKVIMRELLNGNKIKYLWIRAHGGSYGLTLSNASYLDKSNIHIFGFYVNLIKVPCTIILESCNTADVDKYGYSFAEDLKKNTSKNIQIIGAQTILGLGSKVITQYNPLSIIFYSSPYVSNSNSIDQYKMVFDVLAFYLKYTFLYIFLDQEQISMYMKQTNVTKIYCNKFD